MLEKTHLRIADKIADEIGLENKEEKLLKAGSIDPDAWGSWPHHREKEITFLKYIFSSRKKFLQGDNECFYDLGVALHFLQDHWTLSPRTTDKHTKYEYELHEEKILSLGQLKGVIRKAVLPEKSINIYLNLVQTLIKIREGGIVQWYDGIWEYGWKNIFSADISELKPAVVGGISAAIARLSLIHLPLVRDAPLEKEELVLFHYFEALRSKKSRSWNKEILTQNILRKWSTPAIDLNLAYWISRIISKYVFMPQNKEKNIKGWYSKNDLDHIVDNLFPNAFYSHEGWKKETSISSVNYKKTKKELAKDKQINDSWFRKHPIVCKSISIINISLGSFLLFIGLVGLTEDWVFAIKLLFLSILLIFSGWNVKQQGYW